jgi:hypothetical protein
MPNKPPIDLHRDEGHAESQEKLTLLTNHENKLPKI